MAIPNPATAAERPLSEPVPSSRGRDLARRRTAVPLSVAVLLVPAAIGGVRLLLGLHRPYDHAGDAAILEAAIRRVATGTQTLGPYSRFGFKQPGPAYLFLQAPFSWVTGGSPRAMFLGALGINLGAAVGSVVVVRRFAGEVAARWAAVVQAALLAFLTPALLADPWNPYVLAFPLLLAALLAAAGAAGSLPALAGAAVVGSYVIQTHLSTGATVLSGLALASGLGLARTMASRRETRHATAARTEGPGALHRSGYRRAVGGVKRPRSRLVVFGAVAVLVVLWVPPLAEQATHSPGNLTKTARFFTRHHPEFDRGIDHSLSAAAREVSAQLTVLPFGRKLDAEPNQPAREAVAGAGLLVSAAVSFVGWRRRQSFVAALGAMSLVGTLAAWWSATRVVGEVFPYLLVWASSLLIPAWTGAGILALSARPSSAPGQERPTVGDGRRGGPLIAVIAAGLGVVLSWSMLRAPLPPVPSSPDVSTAAGLARRWLAATDIHQVRVRVGEPNQWPLAAGVIERLERDGFDVTTDQTWPWLFGDQFAPTSREGAALWLAGVADSPPGAERQQRLGAVGRSSVWAGPVDAR